GAINLELITQLAASSFSLYKRSPTSTAASPQSLKPSPSRKSIVTPILLSKMSQQAEIKNGSPEVKEPSPKIPKLDHDSSVDGPTSLSFFFKVKKLSEKAVLPTRGSPLSAGYDLSSASEMKVPARGKALIPTDLGIAVPEGTYARIAPRSGLAWKHSIDVGAGVIDADYRGPVGVILFNYSDVEFEVKEGDRIAQLIIERIITPEVLEVEDLDATVRGEGGFGSTGV
ncbi:Deoxyuridine 5'-triphosphate nucleotidohydrolase, partial [Linum perenne]